jgi:hypothetical protein
MTSYTSGQSFFTVLVQHLKNTDMKTKKIVLSLAMLLFFGSTMFAQSLDDSRVKFLATKDRGVIKVHYAMGVTEPLKVKFYTAEGVIASDKIKGASFPQGVSKRYDVNQINDQDYWIEISSSAGSLTYRIETSKDKKSFTPYLENITLKPLLATANK